MKKIGQYLPVAFAALAFVMLLLTAGGNDAPAETAPPTTEQTVQSTETQGTVEEILPKDAMDRVEQALGRYPLDETAMAACIYDSTLHDSDETSGFGKDANANALARICDEQRMNPVAAFWLLAEEELYAYEPVTDGTISVPAFTLPLQSKKQYPFTAEGTRQLLTDILNLSGKAEDGLGLETELLGKNGAVETDQVFRREGDCHYAYFIYYGERSAHFLCFYTRGGEWIEDVEFQLLNLRYAEGDEEALNRIDQLGDRQAASLMAAAEQLLTGSSRADEGRIDLSYTCDGSRVAIERYEITGKDEVGTLTNYDIRIVE